MSRLARLEQRGPRCRAGDGQPGERVDQGGDERRGGQADAAGGDQPELLAREDDAGCAHARRPGPDGQAADHAGGQEREYGLDEVGVDADAVDHDPEANGLNHQDDGQEGGEREQRVAPWRGR